MTSVNITNDIKKILREKYNIESKQVINQLMISTNIYMNYTLEKKMKN